MVTHDKRSRFAYLQKFYGFAVSGTIIALYLESVIQVFIFMVRNDSAIQQFLKQHQLTQGYCAVIERYFLPLAQAINSHHNSANRPIVIGIHGAQGSGKTTLASVLVMLLKSVYQKQAIDISLDDFYLTTAEREQLATTVHPLLKTRGAPGTHDVRLAVDTLRALTHHHGQVAIPRFNKATDDRFEQHDWTQQHCPTDVVIIEGWCLGASPQTDTQLTSPVNTLEADEDADGTWRSYVNQQLTLNYPALFDCIDVWVMLKAPDFSCVFDWRMEQEDKLRMALADNDCCDQGLMSPAQLRRFIQHYQRISEYCMSSLPNKMDYLIELDRDRKITQVTERARQDINSAAQLLIFTDLDGSLLDHHNYRHDEADELLNRLEQQSVPVIPVSSKTQAEIELLRDSLNSQHPFIVENGAAVFIPVGYFAQPPEDVTTLGGYWVKQFVEPRHHWQQLINAVGDDFSGDFTTLAEAGIDGIIAMTGLNVHAAARAARRSYGEPVAWHGSPRRQKQFIDLLEQQGARVLHGGRFMHVSGNCDKGQALQWLVSEFRRNAPHQRFISLAAGDSQNDCAMLEQADLALLIRSPVHGLPELHRQYGVYVSKDTGPRGWAQGVRDIVVSHDVQVDLNEETADG